MPPKQPAMHHRPHLAACRLSLIRYASLIVAPAMIGSAHPVPRITSTAIPLTLSFASSTLIGGTSTTATVTLSSAAPSGGANVTVTNPLGTTIQAGAAQVGAIQNA